MVEKIEGARATVHGRFVPPPPPRTPKAAATRRRLLHLAGEMFIEHGYEAVSLRDIADRAGLTKSAIYGHFRAKGCLLVEVIRWKLAEREHSPEFARTVADPDRNVDLMRDPRGRDVRLLEVDAAAAARHDPDVAAGMAELYAERHLAIRTAMSQASDPDVMAFVIAALTVGIGMKEAVGVPVPEAGPWHDAITAMLTGAFPHPPGASGW